MMGAARLALHQRQAAIPPGEQGVDAETSFRWTFSTQTKAEIPLDGRAAFVFCCFFFSSSVELIKGIRRRGLDREAFGNKRCAACDRSRVISFPVCRRLLSQPLIVRVCGGGWGGGLSGCLWAVWEEKPKESEGGGEEPKPEEGMGDKMKGSDGEAILEDEEENMKKAELLFMHLNGSSVLAPNRLISPAARAIMNVSLLPVDPDAFLFFLISTRANRSPPVQPLVDPGSSCPVRCSVRSPQQLQEAHLDGMKK